jgi:hypothetical protein
MFKKTAAFCRWKRPKVPKINVRQNENNSWTADCRLEDKPMAALEGVIDAAQ